MSSQGEEALRENWHVLEMTQEQDPVRDREVLYLRVCMLSFWFLQVCNAGSKLDLFRVLAVAK